MVNVRRAVVHALMKQENDGYSNLVLNSALNNFEGNAQERAQFSALFYGVVERIITLDFLLAKCLTKPLKKLDAPVRAILRAGLYQILYMSVPNAVVVNESVSLTRKMGKTSASGMVNAVLRKASNMSLDFEKDYVFENEIERMHVQYSVSKQIAQLLYTHYANECEKILQNTFEKPKLCLRANILQNSASELKLIYEKQSLNTEFGDVPDSLYVGYKGDITKTKLFRNGGFHVQSEASQFACKVLNAKKGEKVLDLCAAPGGKSITIAQYMQNKGELLSFDFAKNRLSLIENAFERMNIKCAKVEYGNAAQYNKICENADKILCDVPCSGLGIIAKKPDIRYKDLQGLNELVNLQSEILENAAKYLKKGGKLVYSTCTINPDENENIVNEFLKNNKNFIACDIDDIPENAIKNDKFISFLPINNKTDGFFIALLEKIN